MTWAERQRAANRGQAEYSTERQDFLTPQNVHERLPELYARYQRETLSNENKAAYDQLYPFARMVIDKEPHYTAINDVLAVLSDAGLAAKHFSDQLVQLALSVEILHELELTRREK